MKKVGVSLSIGVLPLKPQVEEILEVLRRLNVDGFVVLAGHSGLDALGSRNAEALVSEMPDRVFLALATHGTWSAGYLKGMQVACEQRADLVISMDADGSHDPQDIERFVSALSFYEAVMSSRFMPNALNAYPLQRQIISFVGTVLTTMFLTSRRMTDFTSGFEGVRANVLEHVFSKYPPEHWVSAVHGPYHLQNTELRLALIDSGVQISEIPIVYGIKKKGKTFGLKFLMEVAFGFAQLILVRSSMRKVLVGLKGA